MLPAMDVSSPIAFSSEELTWLKASEILDVAPTPPPKDDDIFMQDLSLSISPDFLSNSHPSRSTISPDLRYVLNPVTPIIPPPGSPSQRSLASPKQRSDVLATPPRSPLRPTDSPRSEWIYRRPKSPVATRSPRIANPYPRPRPRPSTGYHPQNYHKPTISSLSRSVSSASTRTMRKASPAPSLESDSPAMSTSTSLTSTSTGQFWSTILRPRSRSERSMPLLKTIPSESQLSLTRPDIPTTPTTSNTPSNPSTPNRIISSPKLMSARPPSVSSTLSSISSSPSPSPSSSRSESPVTPVSVSSSPYGRHTVDSAIHRRRMSYHRRHRTSPTETDSLISSSCPPPSKSILTRTASVSTKDSSHTINKSVKFAAVPIVHYASTGYWDMQTLDGDDSTMGINVDSMDIDEDPFATTITANTTLLRELQATPTPEREREKAKGLKKLMSLTRKPVPTVGTNTSVATAVKPSSVTSPPPSPPPKSTSSRPVISTPYALGSHPAQSTVSLRASSQRSRKPSGNSITSNGAAGSVPDLHLLQEKAGLRSAPSMESFRSSKSAGARSVRSLGSLKSTSSARGLRAWFGRAMGWTEP
ncbi:hypothetical protein BDZ97DRAFT_1912261 [Flammula alnicola]|nr:hypothetical protein BDZ97DRAFT_1912261 [Flammula alnicola]